MQDISSPILMLAENDAEGREGFLKALRAAQYSPKHRCT
jgi:hypothetical protein